MSAKVLRVGAICLVATVVMGCGAVRDVVDRDSSEEEPGSGDWEEQAAAIEGIVNYRAEQPEILTNQHVSEPVDYEVLPPVGGDHDQAWQNCNGMVYTWPIVNEHAVHSLEHGAVWITYQPDLALDQVAALSSRVGGNDKLFMSPFLDLDAPISLQAWGYQLKVDSADDERIDEFIRALRVNASLEGPTAPCDGGVTITEADAPEGD